MKIIGLNILALLLTAIVAQASITITWGFGSLRDSSGNVVPEGATVVMFVDTGGGLPSADDLSGAVLTTGQTVGGSEILDIFATSDAVDPGGVEETRTYTLDGNIASGADIGIYWFLDGVSSGDTLTGGESYGSFTSSDVGVFGDWNMTVPNDGSAVNILYYDTSLGGGVSESDFWASNNVAVPEPSSLALIGLGAIGFIIRRRK
ncbi:PEP-CTERM sorting domain-containing protein [Persicirhabdus sediminis]|uniref:PEP-CTERM sorting domain-containing protein n=1 Tax=Persicirhabdus sediminis TaxID=454144 RepID=A0A8J7MFG4_9BACT|nr:PEP-CTERM sorting domain-containing protein [Persicirhabdus sediminis]MBK1792471.1 PEP-CTERM sorting domain-containing protein [Persicirhabdus sediminis]